MNNASVNHHFNEDKYNLYKNRVIVYCVFLLLALIICTFLSFNIVKREEIAPINYTDTGVVDYRVYLKENEFYTENFLPMGKSYITSLIDYIDINYNYIFNIDDLASMNFEYEIVGDLIIEDNNNKSELLSKEYDIGEVKKKELSGTNELAINEKFQIDYSYYNQLANKFRSSYGVDTNSYLKVYLSIKKDTISDNKYALHETNNINEIIIPLSEKAIEINIDTTNNKTTNQVTFNTKNNVNYIIIIIVIILIILSLYFIKVIFVSFKKMCKRRSAYDKYVNKLLKEYDRLIVVTKTLIDFRKYNIIKVAEFTELLDVRDNLKIPINYYCYVKHLKGMFYIKSDNDIYVLFISSEELERDK